MTRATLEVLGAGVFFFLGLICRDLSLGCKYPNGRRKR